MMNKGFAKRLESLKRAMQLVFYVCAQNSDVAPSTEQKTIYRKPVKIKDKYFEVQTWDVGIRIAGAIRRKSSEHAGQSSPEDSQSRRVSPRPHKRRGHWHHYWTGPRNSEQTLVLRWVAPTIVGIYEEGNGPVVIHKE